MRLHGLIAASCLLGCAQGEPFTFGVPGPSASMQTEDEDEESEDEGEGFVWSIELGAGARHRLVADDGATVLSASRSAVTVSRFERDGTRTWSSDVPQIFGGAPVEIGRTRAGDTVVVGSPGDGDGELVVVALSSSGAARWNAELLSGGGVLEARGVAVHANGSVAVVAQEFADARPVRTLVAILDADGRPVSRETFSQPRDPVGVVADTTGFNVYGHAPAGVYAHATWVRSYAPEGFLDYATIVGVGLTGVFTRTLVEGVTRFWVAGIVDETQSCLLPAFGDVELDMKESPDPNPLSIGPEDAVLAIDSDRVLVYPFGAGMREFIAPVGTPTHLAVGPLPDDPVFVLGTDDATATQQLHLLSY